MLGTARPADTDLVVLGDAVLNIDVKLGERSIETVEERIKAVGSDGIGATIVNYGFGCEQFRDRFASPLIPHQLEPTPAQISFVLGHFSSRGRLSYLKPHGLNGLEMCDPTRRPPTVGNGAR